MIEIHQAAKDAFAAAAEDLLRAVKAYPDAAPREGTKFNIHPHAVIQESEIIGTPEITERAVDRTGTELGRFWSRDGRRFKWDGEDYQRLKRLGACRA